MFRHLRVLLTIGLLLAAANLGAQQNATVQGIVVDESQAVMPGTTITATEVSTGVQFTAIAEADGRYRFDNVAPGKYKLKAWHYQLSPTAAATETDITVAKNDMAADLVVGVNGAAGAR